MRSNKRSLFKLILITVMLFISAVAYTYGKNNTPNTSNVIHVNSHIEKFKPTPTPELNPVDVSAATNIRLYTA